MWPRRRWVVSSTPRPHFIPRKDLVPILQEAGWALGLVWMGGKSCPHRDSISDHPARSQSLYRLSYLAHPTMRYKPKYHSWKFSKRAQHLVILGTLYTILQLLFSMPCTHIIVSIGTRLPSGRSGVPILARVRDLSVSKTTRPHLGPIQPPIYGYHGSLPGVKWLCHEVYHSHQSSVRLRMSGLVSLLLQYGFMAWIGSSLPVPFLQLSCIIQKNLPTVHSFYVLHTKT